MNIGWTISLAMALVCLGCSLWLYRHGERRATLSGVIAVELSLVITTAVLAFGRAS